MALDPDKFVAELPDSIRDARPLPGFVGRSDRTGHVRLHRLSDPKEFLDIPEAAIVHSQRVAGMDRTNVADHSILWVEQSANMDHVVPVSFTTPDKRASLLRGGIVSAHFPGSGQSGVQGGAIDELAAAGSSGEQSRTTLDCWHCCSVALSGC